MPNPFSNIAGAGGGSGRTGVLLSTSSFADVAALEVFTAANASELVNSDTEVSRAFVGGSLYEYQGLTAVFTAGEWADITPAGLNATMMAVLTGLVAVPVGDLPARTAGGYETSGATSEADRISTAKSFETGLNSLLLADAYAVRSTGRTLTIENMATGDIFRLLVAGTSNQPRILVDRPDQTEVFQAIDTDNITNPNFTATIPAFDTGNPESSQYVKRVTMRFDPSSKTTNINIRISISGTLFQSYNYSSITPSGPNNEFEFIYTPPVDVLVGDTFMVEVTSSDGDVVVKGDAVSGVPYQSVLLALGDVEELALSSVVDELQQTVNTILANSFNSGRGFVPFNDGFTIDNTNLATFEDRNLIYAPKIDKVVDVFLPSDADIAAAGLPYPIVFEFTHLGGTARIPGNNLCRLIVAGGNSSLRDDGRGVLQRNDVLIVEKTGVGVDWVATTSSFDTSASILPSGVFDLQTDLVIDNIANMETLLTGRTITAGESFLVEVGGSRFGVVVGDRSVITALVDSPDLTTTSDDWLVIENGSGSITNEQSLFLNQAARTGTRFDLSRNVFVAPENVLIQNNQATGVPVSEAFLTPNSQNVETRDLGTLAIPINALVGGSLTLEYEIRTAGSSGFLPEFREIKLNYGGSSFTFNILNTSLNTRESVTIQIPNADYTAAINVNPTASITYIERGAQWVGSVIINGVTNMLTGTLHDPIINLITNEITPVQTSLGNDIASNTALINAVKRTTDTLAVSLDNPVLNLAPPVSSYLLNDVSVTQADSTTQVATPFNTGLNSGSAGLIFEANSPAQSAGKLTTDDFLATDSKLLYVGTNLTDGSALIESVNGGTTQVLMNRVGTNLTVNQFVPAHGGGSRTETHYPSPPNQVGYAGRWFTLDLTSASHEPISSELFFTNDLPTTATSITVYSQILANGGVYNPVSRVFTFGGASDVTETFTEGAGAESVFVTVTYRAASRDIRVTAVPHVSSGLAIDDLQVRFEWSETITEAAFSASSRAITVLPYVENTTVLIGIKPSATGNIIIITSNGEVDTGYSYATYLGLLEVTTPMSMAFDALISLNQSLLVQLNNRLSLPYFGLFVDDHNQLTELTLDTQLNVTDVDGTKHNALSHVEVVGGKTVQASIVDNGAGGYELTFTEL